MFAKISEPKELDRVFGKDFAIGFVREAEREEARHFVFARPHRIIRSEENAILAVSADVFADLIVR